MNVLLYLSLVACGSIPREGTAVGNPTNMAMDVAPASDAKIAAASVEVDLTRGWSCEGEAQVVSVGQRVDLGAGAVPVPAGPLCALEVVFGGPLQLDLLGDDAQVAVSLPVDAVRLQAAEPVSAEAGWVLRLGAAGWIALADARAIALGDLAAEEAAVRRLVEGTSLHPTEDAGSDGVDEAIMTTATPDEDEADAGEADNAGGGARVPGAAGRANGINRGNGNGNGNGNRG